MDERPDARRRRRREGVPLLGPARAYSPPIERPARRGSRSAERALRSAPRRPLARVTDRRRAICRWSSRRASVERVVLTSYRRRPRPPSAQRRRRRRAALWQSHAETLEPRAARRGQVVRDVPARTGKPVAADASSLPSRRPRSCRMPSPRRAAHRAGVEPSRPTPRWPARSASWRTTGYARASARRHASARVLLGEAADRMLASFPESLSRKATRDARAARRDAAHSATASSTSPPTRRHPGPRESSTSRPYRSLPVNAPTSRPPRAGSSGEPVPDEPSGARVDELLERCSDAVDGTTPASAASTDAGSARPSPSASRIRARPPSAIMPASRAISTSP